MPAARNSIPRIAPYRRRSVGRQRSDNENGTASDRRHRPEWTPIHFRDRKMFPFFGSEFGRKREWDSPSEAEMYDMFDCDDT